jgi:anti-anti-sigma factor
VSAHPQLPHPATADLGIVVDQRGTATHIELEGECDLATRGALLGAATQALSRSPERVVLELGRVTFIDASGIGVVLELARRCRAHRVHLVICPGPREVQDAFGLCGLIDVLPFIPTSLPGELRDPVSPSPGDAGSGGAPSSRAQRRRSSSSARRPAPCHPSQPIPHIRRSARPCPGQPT